MSPVFIGHLREVEVLRALYRQSAAVNEPTDGSILARQPLSEEQAATLLEGTKIFKTLNGRRLDIDLSGDYLNTEKYDGHTRPGLGEAIIERLADQVDVPGSTITVSLGSWQLLSPPDGNLVAYCTAQTQKARFVRIAIMRTEEADSRAGKYSFEVEGSDSDAPTLATQNAIAHALSSPDAQCAIEQFELRARNPGFLMGWDVVPAITLQCVA